MAIKRSSPSRSNLTAVLWPLLLRIVLVLILSLTVTAQQQQSFLARRNLQQQQQQCDWYDDQCQWQFDGQCENDYNSYGCWGADCWDCDVQCQQFNFHNCSVCVQAGCVWCPTDGICLSTALNATFWDRHPDHVSSCQTELDWQHTCSNNDNNNNNVFSDPLYDSMKWSYKLINVEPIWRQGILGKGIQVRINDVGIDIHHDEFQGRFDLQSSCRAFISSVANSTYEQQTHGTATASIIGAAANNNDCAVGIAPQVTLSACSFQADDSEKQLADLLTSMIDRVDVSSNSWGPDTCVYLHNNNNGRRHLQSVQRHLKCIFNSTRLGSPCDACANFTYSSDNSKAPSTTSDLSRQCQVAIIDYCKTNYAEDPIACGEFLDLFVSCEYNVLSDTTQAAFVRGITEGREGKGIIYVFAGGNSYRQGGFTNADGFINSRYTISVGAVDKDGRHASYSTPGSALVVSAPGGDFEYVSNNIVANPGGGCHDITIGTSFSAPVVTGVIALMLEVNPNLGWRDVQGILAATAQQAHPEDNLWTINGAGLHHNINYGFGIVDAEAAVNASRTWINYGPEQQLILESGVLNLTIADNASTDANSWLRVDADNYIVESAVVYLSLSDASRGDLEITLTSASGTQSILQPSHRPENTQLPTNAWWKLMTIRNWGEQAKGLWRLSIVDQTPGILGTCSNLPYEYVYRDGQGQVLGYSCVTVQQNYDCINGKIWNEGVVTTYLDESNNNISALVACCACGGGVNVTNINMLRSWKMIIYGHELDQNDQQTANSSNTDALTVVQSNTSDNKATDPSGSIPDSTSVNGTSGGNLGGAWTSGMKPRQSGLFIILQTVLLVNLWGSSL